MSTPKSRIPARAAASRVPASARQSTLRETNLGLVVRTVYAAAQPMSRADVAVATSMTRSTVSRLVDELVAGGILIELDAPANRGPGRPAVPLAPGTALAALGMQVNATFLAARVVDLSGQVVAERIETGDFVASDPQSTLSRVSNLAAMTLESVPIDTTVVGAHLALPGIVSAETGHLFIAPNLGWSDLEPAALMDRKALRGATIRVGNEADLASRTVAEAAPGHPGPLRDFIYLSGEIGIGGAAVLDGAVMTGRHGWAGEIGHVCVDPSGPACRCGSTGCVEQYAGRQALFSAAGLPIDAPHSTLADALEHGDPRALRAVEAAARALGIALAGVVNVLDIPAIVLGGHLGHIAAHLRPELEAQLTKRVLSARWVAPTITTAPDDPAAGATGAALSELADALSQPTRWLRPRRD